VRTRHVFRPVLPAILAGGLACGAAMAQAPARSPLSPVPDATAPGRIGGKATNRATTIEPAPAGLDAPQPLQPPGSKPSLPVGSLIPPTSSVKPLIPVFANPAMQGAVAGKPPVEPPRPPQQEEGPDWRVSHAPPDPAFGAFQRGLYLTALREALDAAAKDPTNTAAMTLIGEIYRDGLAGKQNWLEAARWYRLADERGDPRAAFALARAHLEGAGVPADLKQARRYFERAAAKDHPAALYNLGIMAIEGELQDYKKAAELFTRASALGDLDATYSLALLYRNAQGVDRDDRKGAELLKAAADQHHLPAMIDYAIALFNGRGTEPDEPGAAAYLIRAAWRNAPVAQNRLARMYSAGRGVKFDMVEAMKWHVIAKSNGLKDEWLDAKLRELTPSQREIVEEAVRKFAVK
jgi:TPR repeat protein